MNESYFHFHRSKESRGHGWFTLWWGRLSRSVRFEWAAKLTGFGASIEVDTDGDYLWTFAVWLGFLSLYLCCSPPRTQRASFHKEWSLRTHDHALWACFGMDPDCWNSDEPRWRRWSWYPVDFFLGSQKCVVTKGESFETVVPMPEASYPATVTYETRVWNRPRWPFALTRKSSNIEIPSGVPFEGKGENSWDCGDDGLFGTGCEGHSVSDAVGQVVASVYRERLKNSGTIAWEARP